MSNDNSSVAAGLQQPVAWRVDGKRNHQAEVWFYYKPEWPTMHEKHGDKVTPLYASPVFPSFDNTSVRDALAGLNDAIDLYWNEGRTDGQVKNICYWQFKAKEALSVSRPEAKQPFDRSEERKVLDWVESWVSNPVGSYSVYALDGLFRMTREKIAAVTRPDHRAPARGERNIETEHFHYDAATRTLTEK